MLRSGGGDRRRQSETPRHYWKLSSNLLVSLIAGGLFRGFAPSERLAEVEVQLMTEMQMFAQTKRRINALIAHDGLWLLNSRAVCVAYY